MPVLIALAVLLLTAFGSSVVIGIRGGSAWIVPGGLAILAALYMSYLLIYTTTCESCKNFQSSPEEVRFIFTFYATLVFAAGLLLSAIGHAVGRLMRRLDR